MIESKLSAIKKQLGNSCDISSRIIKVKNKKIAYIFLESVSSDDKISDFLVKSLNNVKLNLFESLIMELKNSIYNSKLTILEDNDDIFYYLSSGFTCIFVDDKVNIRLAIIVLNSVEVYNPLLVLPGRTVFTCKRLRK